MAWFKKKVEERADSIETIESLLVGLINPLDITKDKALNIPTVAACIELISNTIATIPIKLYKEADEETTEVIGDVRTKLLNDETGDLLDSFQYKKALITDYLLEGEAYTYINKELNNVKSLHYVDEKYVTVTEGIDPIFKKVDMFVNGEPYREFEFIRLLRKTKNGVSGRGILQENQRILSVGYATLIFEESLVATGGNKKGFLLSKNKLSEPIMTALKEAWLRLYSNNNSNVVILNEGMEFKEASNTSVEMQLNENKKSNSDEICKILNVPPSMLNGTATPQDKKNFIQNCIMPIVKAWETATNKSLLLESEKGSFYFACDTKELVRGDIMERYGAYKLAVEAGWIQKNEIRYMEDFKKIDGFDIVTMSLGEVIYDTVSKKYFTPNMDTTMNSNMVKEKVDI